MIELCTAALLFAAAPDSVAFQAYDARGAEVELSAICAAIAEADVVFLGERHDDATAHAIQLELLATASASARSADRPLVLGLEMVETDVQLALDEYLADMVRERDWLAAGRPWGNYEADYRPLVEFAKREGHAVVGTNAPARYVSLVSRRGGIAVLDSLSATARAWLPPVVPPPSDGVTTAFTELMGGMAHGAGPSVEGMLAAQNLRDASMAWKIAEALALNPGALVLHVNGSFHSAGGRGIPEHLARLAPEARVLIVTMAPDVEPGGGEDFVVRTVAPATGDDQ